MNTVLYWAASFALVCFALGMVLAAVRLLRAQPRRTACWRWTPSTSTAC